MKTKDFDVKWLEDLVNSFPELTKNPKNFFDISGFPRRENVNSNLLAFYFDKNEEHGFKTLFIDSLLEIISEQKGDSFEIDETDFSVEREVFTNKGNRIDILIKGIDESWAIIIENKVDAGLYNDLSDYWESTQVGNGKKCGIVLSVEPMETKNGFINITHKLLIEKVVANLGNFYAESNDRHLLFLKDYISYINNFYGNKVEVGKMENILKKFHENADNIRKLQKTNEELQKFLTTAVDEVLKSFELIPASSNKVALSRHFEFDKEFYNQFKEKLSNKFRFWIDYEHIKFEQEFLAYFELFGKENTKKGEKLRTQLKKISNKEVQIGTGGRAGGNYCHIYKILIPLENPESGFKEHLKNKLSACFFNNDKDYISTAVFEFENIKP